jgi:hypothetical protein
VSAPKKGPETVRQLAAAPYNPRAISEKRGAQLAKSMEKFGDLSSITFNRRTGRLVSGHQRVKHLQPNARIDKKPVLNDPRGTVATGTIVSGKNLWPYREVDWDESTEKAANIAANAAGGDFDDAKLGKLVRELDGLGVDLDVLNLASLEDILGEPDPDASAGADGTPSAGAAPFVKRGEVWLLGEHRLMCGDSTSRRDVEQLMGTDLADLVFTDPPYGVSFKSEGNEFAVIEGDDKRDDDLYALVAGALKRAVEAARDTAAFYVWHASSTRREFEDALRDAGLIERQYIIWVKNAIVLGHADYQWGHEPCFYAAKAGHRPAWHGDRAQPTVWRVTLKARGKAATTLGTALTLTDGTGGGYCPGAAPAEGQEVADRQTRARREHRRRAGKRRQGRVGRGARRPVDLHPPDPEAGRAGRHRAQEQHQAGPDRPRPLRRLGLDAHGRRGHRPLRAPDGAGSRPRLLDRSALGGGHWTQGRAEHPARGRGLTCSR